MIDGLPSFETRIMSKEKVRSGFDGIVILNIDFHQQVENKWETSSNHTVVEFLENEGNADNAGDECWVDEGMGSISLEWLHTEMHQKMSKASNLVETSSMALGSDQVKKTQDPMSSSRTAGILDDFQLLPSSFAAKHSDREASNDPLYPPGFEPQMLGEQDKMSSSTMEVQPQVLSDETSRSGIIRDETMFGMGFGNKWTNWIMECVRTASMSILVNGSPTSPFSLQRGLRQGDPLSPFLFLLISETFNRIVLKGRELGVLKGIKVGADQITITHLQFPDDTIIFCPADAKIIDNYKKVLQCYALMSGLKINYKKSTLIPLNCDENWVERVRRSLNCGVSKLPLTYLGIPLGASPHKAQTVETNC
ncbi:hypothetical protein SASPL_136862 [Salvia splendens]|uniref:Reverse transcriptase domain-containing protein n=1 Tax=Salvia splendens TaxID=180675 RepID=A0A8X8X319_SALSN|nr:hypothetical protein SASPL_136862 [Salvia splendens]